MLLTSHGTNFEQKGNQEVKFLKLKLLAKFFYLARKQF